MNLQYPPTKLNFFDKNTYFYFDFKPVFYNLNIITIYPISIGTIIYFTYSFAYYGFGMVASLTNIANT